MEQAMTAPLFNPGDRVEKFGGSYSAPGIIVKAFDTLDGEVRYVVDFSPVLPGLLHIFGERQLRPLTSERCADYMRHFLDLTDEFDRMANDHELPKMRR